MNEKSGFFNSVNHDRVYDASDVARFLSKFFTNGIFNNSLKVSANDNMTVSVAIGNANINGYSYELTDTLTLDIAETDTELNRIDSVIIRLDLSNRAIKTQILEGNLATTPGQPSIIRSGNIYDLRLANISVPAGATRITTDMITDTRFSSDCGNVTQAVQHLDTSEIFNQYETWFETWFNEIKKEYEGDPIGNLKSEIGILENLDTTNKDNLVDSINEVNQKPNDILEILGLDKETYSNTKTYKKGDLVIHNNKIYECIAETTTGTFDNLMWEFVPVFVDEE